MNGGISNGRDFLRGLIEQDIKSISNVTQVCELSFIHGRVSLAYVSGIISSIEYTKYTAEIMKEYNYNATVVEEAIQAYIDQIQTKDDLFKVCGMLSIAQLSGVLPDSVEYSLSSQIRRLQRKMKHEGTL